MLLYGFNANVLRLVYLVAHHVVTRKQLLQELCLFRLHCLDDELIIAGEVKPGTASTGVGQLYQRLIAYGVLKFKVRQQFKPNNVLQSTQGKFTPHCREPECEFGSPPSPDSRLVWCQRALWSSEKPVGRMFSDGNLGSDVPGSGCYPHWNTYKIFVSLAICNF